MGYYELIAMGWMLWLGYCELIAMDCYWLVDIGCSL